MGVIPCPYRHRARARRRTKLPAPRRVVHRLARVGRHDAHRLVWGREEVEVEVEGGEAIL